MGKTIQLEDMHENPIKLVLTDESISMYNPSVSDKSLYNELIRRLKREDFNFSDYDNFVKTVSEFKKRKEGGSI